ncbi:putative ribonuclease H protein [Glycine max]|nr:putative ribonuclease H protein [Glycine max]
MSDCGTIYMDLFCIISTSDTSFNIYYLPLPIKKNDISAFNQWISDMELREIKCAGNSFTWIRPNGCVKSRLDRFLVSEHWLSLWPESCQLVLQRNLSDHCPTILQTSMVDWGPKPFRVFDWWLQQKGYQKMVREAWNNDQQGGWGGIVLKNKLKNFKAAIKQWSKKLNEVENLAFHRILSDQELKDRNSLQQELWNASNAFESLMTQKSRARWLNEGDYSTGYFPQNNKLHKWPDSSQCNLERNYSNHCPIIMKSKSIDWGPKPFKVFDAWLKNKEYQKVVRDCWAANQLFGWGGFVLKNKLKILKARLKLWSKENAADMCNKMKQIQQELNDLENSMPSQPSVQQVQLLKKLQAELWEKANLYESTLRQKSRSRWIKKGDNNTNYFHKLINHSRRRNNLRGLTIDNSWVEDPNLIKAEILQHFQRRFHESQLHRPNLDGVSVNVLTHTQRDTLVILRSFELVSGLRINFAKSKFGVVGQSEEWCLHAANYLNCALVQFPLCYLGILIVVNPKRRVVWDPVIRKFEDRLNRWNKRNISMAGRLTLIKASLIRLSSIQRQFLWGGKQEEKKIAWVSWTQCSTSRDVGGLGWKWFMFHQPHQLWNRILISKYKGWRGLDQGPHKQHFSTWWADLKALNQDHSMTAISKQFCWKMGRGVKCSY